jgi:hypothetical protein
MPDFYHKSGSYQSMEARLVTGRAPMYLGEELSPEEGPRPLGRRIPIPEVLLSCLKRRKLLDWLLGSASYVEKRATLVGSVLLSDR